MGASARIQAVATVSSRTPRTTVTDLRAQSELWGADTFGPKEMKARLPKDVYNKLMATLHSGSIWADGFLSAVDDFADDWPRPRDDDDSPDAEGFRAMLQLMDVLRSDPQDEAVKAFGAAQWKGGSATREEMLDETCFAVQDLRLYWLDHGPKPEQRRVEATPGRNDPCPCGSGKKYKKCHGAMA